jgi:beta-1,4-mannosyltransferase
MIEKKAIYLYPITNETEKEGSNTYIRQLRSYLSNDFTIVNRATSVGLLDAFAKLRKADLFYFNWIEDVPTKKFGLLQSIIFPFLLILCKLTGKKIVWFVHNNISHNNRFLFQKKVIIQLMLIFSDLILSHSNEVKLNIPKTKLLVFHHPVEPYHVLKGRGDYKYDLLIWGSISPYKGIAEFIRFAANSRFLTGLNIMVAGKFHSNDYYEMIMREKADNVSILNQVIPHDELVRLFSESRYILFTYSSSSVLSSAALCKSLSHGKEVIGPNIGSFKELGQFNLVHNFHDFKSLESLLVALKEGNVKGVPEEWIRKYAEKTTWANFTDFLRIQINNLYENQLNLSSI